MKRLLLGLILLACTQVHAQFSFEQIDIWTGSSGSTPKYITEFNGMLYFQAADVTNSFKKMYKSDGTETGTTVLATNLNGGSGYYPESLFVMNGELYFTALEASTGLELYKTDGTDAGTVLLKDTRPGSSGGMDNNANFDKQLFVELNNELFFRASNGSSIALWKTDGTPSGTVVVKDFEDAVNGNGSPVYVPRLDKDILGVTYNNMFYFFVSRSGENELWKTDGTTANTTIVRAGLENIEDMVVFDNLIYFGAEDPTTNEGTEMWVSDGTTAGTMLKFDIYPNNLNPALGFGSSPDNFFIFNNELYFLARSYDAGANQIIGVELWKTDGTSATLVKDIDTDNFSSGLNIPRFTIFQNELYFIASDNTTSDYDLWKTDGTESGTVKVVSAADTGTTFQFINAIPYGDNIVYHNFQQLWVTDGTLAGTQQLTGNSEEIIQTQSGSLFPYQNKLWFAGNKIGNGVELTSLQDANVLSVETVSSEALELFPNPAADIIRFNGIKNNSRYTIIDISGRTLSQGTITSHNSQIDVSQLQTGMYFVQLDALQTTIRFIKK